MACALAGILATAALGACGGDDVLAPPDGTACTAGSVSPGDSVVGSLTSTSCEVFNIDDYGLTVAESWTLNVKKGTAYVIRVRHQSAPGLADAIGYDLLTYGRNPQGDATFLTGWWDSFGTNNGAGGYNEEMFFTATSDRTLSLRVQAYSPADTGAYSLTVHSCPMVMLDGAVDSATVDLSHGCEALSLTSLPVKASFFAFEADSVVTDTTTITRTDGAASFLSHAGHPGYDINCWNSDCDYASSGFGTSATLYNNPAFPTHVTGYAAIHADSAATVSIKIGTTVPAAPPALMPASTVPKLGRHTGRN